MQSTSTGVWISRHHTKFHAVIWSTFCKNVATMDVAKSTMFR
jgi:hypothetical protein